jgi:CheY-specific phosphatase CheX
MFVIFKTAVNKFLESIDGEAIECKSSPASGYMSEIDIKGDVLYKIYVVFQKTHLDAVSEIYFGDTNYEIDDLLNEITNQIVGNAKVVANEHNTHFDISIPQYLGEYKKIDSDYLLKFKFKNRCFYLIFKEEF